MKRTIKGLRNDLGLNQREMAELINVPIASYQRYENYATSLPFSFVIRVADVCGVEDLRTIKFEKDK